jgi:uncharacterized protein (TIGR00251 family)
MINLTEHPEGIILPVRVQPGARKTAIVGDQGGALKITVTAPPEDGRANKALLEVLRTALNLKRTQVELFSGHTSRDKRVLIRGMSAVELQRVTSDVYSRRRDGRHQAGGS